MASRNPPPTARPKPRPGPAQGPASEAVDEDSEFASWLGERVRRIALGLTAALLSARAYWPSEPDFKLEASTGLGWDLAILIVAGLAIASALIGGTLRLRRAWTDAAAIALMSLVALAASQAHARRVAIDLAWDWGGFALAYLLVRSLPRTRAESSALAGVLVATAVAVSVYGLYQVGFELPQTRAYYQAHRAEVLRQQGITPGTPAQVMFEDRLLGSNEPLATFALTNSLAGFLLGPMVLMLVVGWENLIDREGKGRRLETLALAIPPALVVLVCLLLTKSRSAYVGFAAALVVLAWRERRRVRARTLLLAGAAGAVVLVCLVLAALATGRLDRLVLTQSTKSLRFRAEYWVGAWRVITETPRAFWKGHGPGNFLAPYLRHKLPQSSEEISDPHNLVLEVGAAGGVLAMVALLLALGTAFRELLRPEGRSSSGEEDAVRRSARASSAPGDPPRHAGWLVACGGAGWLVVCLLGRLNPFEGDLFFRWLILGGAWLWTVAFGFATWRRLPIPAIGLGAGALAMAVHMLAAGGIGLAAVALMFWASIALGLNLVEDRPAGRLREPGGRLAAFGLAMLWAALIGTFAGAVVPFWKSEAAIVEAEEALRSHPPQFEKADDAYDRAIDADKYNSRPWFGKAHLKFLDWEARGAKVDDRRWKAIPIALLKASTWPRNPYSWSYHRERAMVTRDLIKRLEKQLSPGELLRLRGNVVEASRTATRFYPSNATLHAELAQASAEIGMYADAVGEAREAIRLSDLTPHLDKKLSRRFKDYLLAELPRWEAAAPGTPSGSMLRRR